MHIWSWHTFALILLKTPSSHFRSTRDNWPPFTEGHSLSFPNHTKIFVIFKRRQHEIRCSLERDNIKPQSKSTPPFFLFIISMAIVLWLGDWHPLLLHHIHTHTHTRAPCNHAFSSSALYLTLTTAHALWKVLYKNLKNKWIKTKLHCVCQLNGIKLGCF